MNAAADAVEGAPEEAVAEPAPPKSRPPDPPKPKKCPECVPGAPMWMATFSDMATLLLCFFVLILSFAEMNVPKFKQISGSMQNSFGVQREIPVVEQPKGTTILSLNFSPSPTVALVDNLKQETTDTTQPEIEVRTKDADPVTEEPLTAGGRQPQDSERPGGKGAADGNAPDNIAQDAERIRQALAAEVAAGRVDVAATNTRVTVQFNAAQNATAAERIQAAQAVASGMKKLNELTPQLTSEVAVTGATSTLVAAIEAKAATTGADTTGEQGGGGSKEKTDQAAKDLEQAFAGEIKEGLVKVERKDGAVVVKIGSGGAFPTGDATLTPLAVGLVDKIGDVANKTGARIVIGGHTDNVPIRTVKYRDNWDLSAARAVSVVRELVTGRKFDPARIEAQGFADTKPVAANDSPANRALNRRIEIEIQMPKE